MAEGRRHQAAFYSDLVDPNFAWVQAVNGSSSPVAVRRRENIGTLYEADMPMACAVELEAVGTGTLLHAQDGTVLPNGITIYGDLSSTDTQRLAEAVMKFTVWVERPSVVDVTVCK